MCQYQCYPRVSELVAAAVVVVVTGQQQAEGAHGHSNEAATRSVLLLPSLGVGTHLVLGALRLELLASLTA